MPRYMIELPFTPETCLKSLPKVSQAELDFLPQVVWNCGVGGQQGWAIVDADTESDARNMVPESLRDRVIVYPVKTLSPELIQAEQEGSIEKAA